MIIRKLTPAGRAFTDTWADKEMADTPTPSLKDNHDCPIKGRISYEMLRDYIMQNSSKKYDEPTQHCLSILISLLPYLESKQVFSSLEHIFGIQHDREKIIDCAFLAARSIFSGNLEVGLRVMECITPRIPAPSYRVYLGLGASIYFLGMSIYFFIIMATTNHAYGVMDFIFNKKIYGMDIGMMVIVGFFGILGSVISMMLRIDEFDQLTTVNPRSLIFMGLFRPIVGFSFSLFIFSCIKSGIITVHIGEGENSEIYFFIALAFVSGFSERLVKNVISRVEGEYASDRSFIRASPTRKP